MITYHTEAKTDKKLSRMTIGKAIFYLIMIIFSIGQFFPLLWVFDFSLCKSSELFASNILKIPDPPQWANYVTAWVDGNILRNFINSFIVNAATIIITVICSLTLGYTFTRMQWKLRGVFLSVILLGMMVPIHATLLPNYMVFGKLKILNTYAGLILPYTAFALPLGVFLMTGFMKTLPKALEESAIIDGCGTYGIIFKIIMPLTKPAIVTIAIMTFLNCWNEFIMAFTYLSKPAYKTLMFSVFDFSGQYVSNYAVQFAVMMLAALPALIVYTLLNEQITKGVTVGAVKG